MKKILHVVSGLRTGGTEMMCLRLIRHWHPHFEQHLLAWGYGNEGLADAFGSIPRLPIDVRPCDLNSRLRQWFWAKDVISRAEPDALLLHCFGVPHLLAASAARAVGIRAIAVKAGNPPPGTPFGRAQFAAVVAASRVLKCPIGSCSTSVERELRALRCGLPARSEVRQNGLDLADIQLRADRSRQQRDLTGPIIGMVARLDSIKDHTTLLAAFPHVLAAFPSAQLWIIGDGPLRTHLEERTRELGISQATRFFGNRADIPDLLGQMDVFAFSTTRDEGFGIALIEAMAARVAIVASGVPACREVLANGQAGRLVEANNADALADALIDVVAHLDKQSAMIAAATRRAEQNYSIAACARRWEEMLFASSAPSLDVPECAL